MAFGQILGSAAFGGTRDARLGDLSSLNTLAKSTIVDAINENDEYLKIMKEIERSGDPTRIAVLHNSIFRGKCIGTSVSEEQWAQIKAGTFNDIWLGDYWTINGVNWRVADIDYLLGWNQITDHNIAIVPDDALFNAQWHTSNDTSKAYYGSTIQNAVTTARTNYIEPAFGAEHIIQRLEGMITACDANGNYSAMTFNVKRKVDLLQTKQVFGHSLSYAQEPFRVCAQMSLFIQAPYFKGTTENNCYWLADVNNSFMENIRGKSALSAVRGLSSEGYCTGSDGVRPWFCIYQA